MHFLAIKGGLNFMIDYNMLSKSTLPQIAGNSAFFSSKQPQIRSRRVSMGANNGSKPSGASIDEGETSLRKTFLINSYLKKPDSRLQRQKSVRQKDLTKMCQKNLNQYLTLRKQISRHYAQNPKQRIKSQRTSDQSPKLTIHQLNLTRKYRLTKVKCNIPYKVQSERPLIIKTDPGQSPPKQQKKMRYLLVPFQRKFFSTSKKYSQLSLREIIESEAEVAETLYHVEGNKGRYQSMAKLAEGSSDEFQPLGGW